MTHCDRERGGGSKGHVISHVGTPNLKTNSIRSAMQFSFVQAVRSAEIATI